MLYVLRLWTPAKQITHLLGRRRTSGVLGGPGTSCVDMAWGSAFNIKEGNQKTNKAQCMRQCVPQTSF